MLKWGPISDLREPPRVTPLPPTKEHSLSSILFGRCTRRTSGCARRRSFRPRLLCRLPEQTRDLSMSLGASSGSGKISNVFGSKRGLVGLCAYLRQLEALRRIDLVKEHARLEGKPAHVVEERLRRLRASVAWSREIGRLGGFALSAIELDKDHRPGFFNDESKWIDLGEVISRSVQRRRPEFGELASSTGLTLVEHLRDSTNEAAESLGNVQLEILRRDERSTLAFGVALGAAALAGGLAAGAALSGAAGVAASGGGIAAGSDAALQVAQLVFGEHPTGSFEVQRLGQAFVFGAALAPLAVPLAQARPLLTTASGTGLGAHATYQSAREGRTVTDRRRRGRFHARGRRRRGVRLEAHQGRRF